MLETLYSYTLSLDVGDLVELKKYLSSQGIMRVSFRRSNVFEGTNRAFNEKDIQGITKEDFNWLTEKEPYGVRRLVIECQLI